MLLSHLIPIILKKTHKHPYHAYTWKKSLVLHCLLLKWESHHLFGFYASEIKFKYFQKILQIISLLFPVVNIEEWALIKPDNLLPQIDGFSCGSHATLNTYYLPFLNTDKDNAASDYCYEDLAASRYWLAYKLKNLKVFEHKWKKNSDFVKDKYIKDIPTLKLKDVKTTLGDNKMFTDIKLLIAEINSQCHLKEEKC